MQLSRVNRLTIILDFPAKYHTILFLAGARPNLHRHADKTAGSETNLFDAGTKPHRTAGSAGTPPI